jgi:sodium transport system permease protein
VAGILARATADPASGADGREAAGPGPELVDVASPEQMGRTLLASSLPLFLAVWILLGGQHAALDVGVGERERGTLEALLTLPAPRSALVAGKFLAVMGPSVGALVVTLAAGVASLTAGAPLLVGGSVRLALPPAVVLAVLVVGVALAALLSAAQLVVSLAARTLREAQQAFTGLYLVTAMPAILAPLAGDLLDRPWIPLVPVVNALWAIRGLLAWGIGGRDLFLVAGTLVALAVPVLVWGARFPGGGRGSIGR